MEKLKMLIANGADPSLKNTIGKSAMDLANEKGDPELIKLLQSGKPAEN